MICTFATYELHGKTIWKGDINFAANRLANNSQIGAECVDGGSDGGSDGRE